MLLLFLLRQNPFGEGTRAKMQFYGFSKPRMKRLQENQCVASQIFHTLLSEAAKDVLKVQQVWSYKLLLRAWKRREESHKRKSLPSSTVISKIRIILGAYRNLTLLLVEFTYGRYPVFMNFTNWSKYGPTLLLPPPAIELFYRASSIEKWFHSWAALSLYCDVDDFLLSNLSHPYYQGLLSDPTNHER